MTELVREFRDENQVNGRFAIDFNAAKIFTPVFPNSQSNALSTIQLTCFQERPKKLAKFTLDITKQLYEVVLAYSTGEIGWENESWLKTLHTFHVRQLPAAPSKLTNHTLRTTVFFLKGKKVCLKIIFCVLSHLYFTDYIVCLLGVLLSGLGDTIFLLSSGIFHLPVSGW